MKILKLFRGLTILMISGIASISSRLTVKWANLIFFKASKHKAPGREKKVMHSAKVKTINFSGKEIVIYEWGKGNKKVLMHHGWSGRAGQFHAFIDKYLEDGYFVVAFDGPAHGRSSGKRSNVFEFSDFLNKLVADYNGFDLCIAHSFGGFSALVGEKRFGLNIKQYVFIGVPVELDYIIEEFWSIARLNRKAIPHFKRDLNQRFSISEDFFFVKNLLTDFKKEIIIIHDKNDKEVEYQQAIILKDFVGNALLYSTENLGHRRILRNAEVIDYVSNQLQASELN